MRIIDIVSSDRTPALHAIVHRYGIPKGTTLEQQEQARAELYNALREAYERGFQDGRECGRRQKAGARG